METPLPKQSVDAVIGQTGVADSTLIEIALFFSEAIAVVEQGHCWLSPDPKTPLSIGYGNRTPRQLLWTVVRHLASGRSLVVATTHVDHRSVEPMLAVVREQLVPVIEGIGAALLLGDLNTHTAPQAMEMLLRHGWRDTHPTGRLDEDVTYLGDLGGGPGRIDHVLVTGGLRSEQWWRGADTIGLGLSDHLPVGGTLVL